jgi:hypothetical protein
MSQLDHDRYHAELRAETARFAEAVHDADPAAPVPTCPAWTLAQLTAHVGFGHRWAAVIVERRAATPVPHGQVDDLRVPAGAEDRSSWLLAGAGRLSRAVRAAGPQAGVWTWADDQTAGFWLRRITHDTLVHRLDAELAVGRGDAGEWLARRTPSGVAWRHGHARGDAALRGPALDLLLVLSRRAALDGSQVEASGDQQLLAHWLEHSRLDPA